MSTAMVRDGSHLSPNAVGMLGVVTAVAIANGYYIQPLLPLMVASVSLPSTLTGVLPALSQFGFVIGIVTVLPLADSLSARRVLFAAVPMQMAALLIIALSWTPPMLMAGCLLVGVAGVTPYVLPPYASLRVPSERLGTVNGVLIRGVNCGILLARAAAGVIAVHLGWRSVYVLAATAMAGVLLAVSRIVKPQRPAAPVGYGQLIRSLWTLPRTEPKLRTAALCQACNFGTFNTFWLGSTFYLHEHWGWRPDAIGYVSLMGAGGVLCPVFRRPRQPRGSGPHAVTCLRGDPHVLGAVRAIPKQSGRDGGRARIDRPRGDRAGCVEPHDHLHLGARIPDPGQRGLHDRDVHRWLRHLRAGRLRMGRGRLARGLRPRGCDGRHGARSRSAAERPARLKPTRSCDTPESSSDRPNPVRCLCDRLQADRRLAYRSHAAGLDQRHCRTHLSYMQHPSTTVLRPFRSPCGACLDCDVRKQAICAALEDDEVGALEAIMTATALEANQTLVTEGDPRRRVFSLTKGMLRLSTLLPDGRRQITGFLMPGDYLGLADDDTYSQTAEAVAPSNLCSFPVVQMDALMERFPRLKDRLYVMTREALRRARDNQIVLGRLAPVEKIASFLLVMARRAADAGRPSDVVDLPMTRTDIADYLGLTVETVSRSFTKLKTQALIQLPDPHHVTMVDREALEAVAGWTA